MNSQEEIQKAFLAFLVQDASANGIEIKSEEELQAYAEELGEDGLKSKYQEFMSLMQSGQKPKKAQYGAKLNYIRSLKGQCPEGTELVQFKNGGTVCNVCKKKIEVQAKGGKPKNSIKAFKEKYKKNKDKK